MLIYNIKMTFAIFRKMTFRVIDPMTPARENDMRDGGRKLKGKLRDPGERSPGTVRGDRGKTMTTIGQQNDTWVKQMTVAGQKNDAQIS